MPLCVDCSYDSIKLICVHLYLLLQDVVIKYRLHQTNQKKKSVDYFV